MQENVSKKETKNFQTETKQLLDLMIHSIYTHREIFLRELISNASDALDKLRFLSLTNPELIKNNEELEIKIDIDPKERTLTISDNGIGMTYDEVVENIGTIARSGSKLFIKNLAEKNLKNDIDLIGQFGVGFYSAFMVAKKVVLITKAVGQDKGVRWESEGDGTYTIEEWDKEDRGTSITLYMRDKETEEKDSDLHEYEYDFLNVYTIQRLVKKYSDYIRYPIKMNIEKEVKPKDENGKIIEDAPSQIEIETKILNSMKPLWERDKKDITKDEYNDFYKHTFHDWADYFEVIHTKAEGTLEYTALLFIPSKAPFDYYTTEYKSGIKLYSKNVFIMDECKDILPDYLKFVKGLVDSPDFSLNISREILQHTRQLKLIGKHLEKKILSTLKDILKEDRKRYEEFWNEFGRSLKLGIYASHDNKEKLENLLLFDTSYTTEGKTTLEEYVSRMKENQTEIYYAVGKDRATVEKLPQMEILKEKGIEVLYFLDKIDEFLTHNLDQYNGKKLRSISRGELNLKDDTEDKKEDSSKKEEIKKESENLLKCIKDNLGGKVKEVRISNRLKSSAVCLVSDESGISLNMEQILTDYNPLPFHASKILELNPDHKLFASLKKIYDKDGNSDRLKDYSQILYDQALLMEGIIPEDPISFANKISNLIVEAEN